LIGLKPAVCVAVERGVADRHLALIAAVIVSAPEPLGDRHQRGAPRGLHVLLVTSGASAHIELEHGEKPSTTGEIGTMS
jgi:hypothetical protein